MKLGGFALGLVLGSAATVFVMNRWPALAPAPRIVADARPRPGAGARPADPATPASEELPPVVFAEPTPATPAPSPFLEPPTFLPVTVPPPTPAPSLETKRVHLPILSTDLDRLRARSLLIPVRGLDAKSVSDTFQDARGSRVHQALDILAPRGTPVVAVEDGHIERLFTSQRGGLTVYQFDPQREYCYYYAHLDRYASGLTQGAAVRKGDVIGYVGTTGNAPPGTPHLHFSIIRLGPEKRWWEGTAVNPYPVWGAPASAP